MSTAIAMPPAPKMNNEIAERIDAMETNEILLKDLIDRLSIIDKVDERKIRYLPGRRLKTLLDRNKVNSLEQLTRDQLKQELEMLIEEAIRHGD